MKRGTRRREGPIARTLRVEKATGGIRHFLYKPDLGGIYLHGNTVVRASLMAEALRGIDELKEVVESCEKFLADVEYYKSCGGKMNSGKEGLEFRGPYSMCNDKAAIRDYILRSKRDQTVTVGLS